MDLLSRWLFCSKSSRHCPSQTAGELKFWENVHPPPCVTCHVSNARCQVSGVTFFWQSGWASGGRVCYQRGLPHLVWPLTPDTWHMTYEMWHVACDMWHVTCDICVKFISPVLKVWDWQCLEDSERNQWINERMNHKGVYRTVPATPGLLKRGVARIWEQQNCEK